MFEEEKNGLPFTELKKKFQTTGKVNVVKPARKSSMNKTSRPGFKST
jgi:hypothetical protein